MTDESQATELGAFLKARRQDVDPIELGLHVDGRRRVKGLRRETVAQRAAISTDYYARIEQGRRPASESVLDAIAEVLQLDADQRAYVFRLAQRAAAKSDPRARRQTPRRQVSPVVQALIDSMVGVSVVVHNGHLDFVATNALGRALFDQVFEGTSRPNMARYVFLERRAEEFFIDWDTAAGDVVAMLRLEAGQAPNSRDLNELIGELSVNSDPFKTRWAAHQVRGHRRGTKRFHHSLVGDLELRYEALEMAETGLTVYCYVPDPESRSAERVQILAAWTAPQPDLERAPTDPEERSRGRER